MAEVCDALLRANLVASLAILAVIASRVVARRWFGPEVAYGLWAAPPLTVAATLMPLKTAQDALHPLAQLTPANVSPFLLGLWAIGVVAAGIMMWRAQAAFLRAAREGRAGPAVVGVIAPRVIMPPDDGRYSEAERALIRAHERAHIERKDPRAGALIVACQCLAWFNPLVHLAAHLARLDQELACDAAVLRRHPRGRALYAKMLLKTQLGADALPLGCHWPARSRHPLELRVALLAKPVGRDGLAGAVLIGAGVFTAAALAWAAEPPTPFTPPPAVNVFDGAETGHMSVILISWPAPRASAAR